MLVFLDQLSDQRLQTDVCIVGAGPAGITLALDLAAKGLDVALCEGGGLWASQESQNCYVGQTVGDEYHYLDATRLRFLGGTSNHWTGVCADLVPMDLAPKPFAPQTAWPIDMEELRPYLTRARDILGLSPAREPHPVLGDRFARLDVDLTRKLRFKDIYLEDLLVSPKIRTILHANLVGLEMRGTRLASMRLQSYSDRMLTVDARHFVIACGGIENARLLLHFNDTHGTDFGRESGALGAYFTEHPHGMAGEYVLFDGTGLNVPGYGGDVSRQLTHVAATEVLLAAGTALNVRLKLRPYRGSGTRQVVKDLMCMAPNLAERLSRGLDAGVICAGSIGTVLEQVPVRENRLVLGSERDRFGLRRPVLHWRRTEQDHQSMRVVATAFAKHMAAADIGRVSLSDWVLNPSVEIEHDEDLTAHHHIGMTRMGATAREGVVDPDCRVYGSDNLYMAGCSIFPSAGHANPTAPLMGMALRLADHLARRS